jgi:hypothetical protein
MATPDAWDDDWETAADVSNKKPGISHTQPHSKYILQNPTATPQKPPSSKITKAQRRARQAEFNRQLWEEAEGPREPNYFLETRGVVPKADFKPPPRLLSRKAPPVAPDEVNGNASSDEAEEKKPTVEEQRALAVKEREEKQRKYEERRLELFGSASTTKAGSGASSPAETPPGSRSATPNRSRGRGGGGGGGRKGDPSRPLSSTSFLSLKPSSIAPALSPGKRELYDPNYAPKPEINSKSSESREIVVEPIRSPRGPDGSGRGGFGFAPRGGKSASRGGPDT